MWHFSDNNQCPQGDRLFKIQPLIDRLLEKFQAANTPNKEVCIDETLVPFRGRLSFKQYIKNKRHKFGIKLYKLCTENGYTFNLKVYCGKDVTELGVPASSSVVMTLMRNVLDSGRILYTDNFYTSVYLAHQLQNRSTHLVGTLRSNRKMNPIDVVKAKLKKNEVIARESNTGVVVLKWKDKRDVLMLSTVHTDDIVEVQAENKKTVQKPKAVVDYNNCKAFIDLSDQMKSYSSALRRGVKWYRKLAVELITGAALTNSHILYKAITQDKLQITKFKEELAKNLLQKGIPQEKEEEEIVDQQAKKCGLIKTEARRRCTVYYETLRNKNGREYAMKKCKQTPYKCDGCGSFFCVECFYIKHKSIKI